MLSRFSSSSAVSCFGLSCFVCHSKGTVDYVLNE
jgi:hypothetical protein